MRLQEYRPVELLRYTSAVTIRSIVGARVSKVQGEEKTSHISQRGKGQAYAESQDWEVVGAFEDLDVSAIKLSPFERPDLREWLDRADEWDALVFAKTDRVFRSAHDCVRLAEWCREHHKILVLVDDGIRLDYYHPEDAKDAFAGAMSKVFLILASVFAEIEGQRFIQRARDRVNYLRDTDRWGWGDAPYGFKVVPHPSGKGKALDFDVEAQKVLSGIATRFLAGDSLTGIVGALNQDGVLSPMDWKRIQAGTEPRGARWSVAAVKKILRNPVTQGVKTYKGKVLLDSNGEPVLVGPASFDAETWNRLQSELAQRANQPRGRRHSVNPLLGVIKCAVCGGSMWQKYRDTYDKQSQYRYYVCNCPKVSMRAADAEEMVEWEFLRRHADRRVKAKVWQDGSDHSAELEQTRRTIESLREDRAMGLFTTPEDELMFRQQMKALVAKRDVLQEMPVTRAGWVDVVQETTYGQAWPEATVEEKRKMLTDAGVTLVVTNPRQSHLDTEVLLGD